METSATIAQWAEETFGPSIRPVRMAARANEEMAELIREVAKGKTSGVIVEECADIVIVLCRLVYFEGEDLWDAVERKMQVNRNREWKLDGTGHGYHVKEEG